MPKAGLRDVVRELDGSSPAGADAKLGTTLAELIAAYNDLAAKHTAFMAVVDTANLAGLGNGNAVAFALAKPVLGALGSR